jgi:hypothetical protein
MANGFPSPKLLMADQGLIHQCLLAPGRLDRSTHLDTRSAPAAQPNACLFVRPTLRTRPCRLADVRPNSQRSAPPSIVSWSRQWPKRISRQWQHSNAPTSTTGPTSGGCLPCTPSGCPHSRTRIGACMPAMLLARPAAPHVLVRPMGTACVSRNTCNL